MKIDRVWEVGWGDLGAYDNRNGGRGGEYVLEEGSWDVLRGAMGGRWGEGEEEEEEG